MLMENHLIILYIILVTRMDFTNFNSSFDLLFQMSIRYKLHQKYVGESLAYGITPFGLLINKAPGIVPVAERKFSYKIEWNFKRCRTSYNSLLLLESKKEVDSSINSNYPDNAEAEAKQLLDKNKDLEKTLEQRCKKKWKTFSDHVDYECFKQRDMTQLQKTVELLKN